MHQSKSLGIDHPLIAVNDIDALRERLIALGFNMTPVGKHPWGTSTSLAIFSDCLLEIMGIYDHQLVDVKPAGDFYFGRHVYKHLEFREGIALTAIHSTNTDTDAAQVKGLGLVVSGHLEFGRDVTLPNGKPDRTKTTLALLPDTTFPRLSLFLCQQHRRELVEVPEWMQHDNTVYGIRGVTIKASIDHHSLLQEKLTKLYGQSRLKEEGFEVTTPNGYIRVQSESVISRTLTPLPTAVKNDPEPAIVAMEFLTKDLDVLRRNCDQQNIEHSTTENVLTLSDASLFGNTIFQFHKT